MKSSLAVACASVVLLAIGLASAGCTTTCDEPTTDSSASGELTYTESISARNARIARTDGGRARIVGERRVPEPESHTPGAPLDTLSVEIGPTTSGNGTPITRLFFSVALPRSDGSYALERLSDAQICEQFRFAEDGSRFDECIGVRGTLVLLRRGGGFVVDVTLDDVTLRGAPAPADAPVLRGTIHVETEENFETRECASNNGAILGL
jgi:hypothetical protein